jgi:UDP-N-acetylglucosamine/UDP-N-acetylgalactosamine diphosphorylase
MTSGNNHEETVKFFEDNRFFTADPKLIVFFKQASLPAIDTSGKIVMKTKHEINQAPNGNGALFEAINTNRKIKNIIKSTSYVQVIGVDNVLNKIMDPV